MVFFICQSLILSRLYSADWRLYVQICDSYQLSPTVTPHGAFSVVCFFVLIICGLFFSNFFHEFFENEVFMIFNSYIQMQLSAFYTVFISEFVSLKHGTTKNFCLPNICAGVC